MQMTPFKIEVLFHYHHKSGDWPNMDAPAFKDALQEFLEMGLLVEINAPCGKYLANYEKLTPYVEELCRIPVVFGQNAGKEGFAEAARPLIKYLAENHHPHTEARVTNILATLMEMTETTGEIMDYLMD